MKAAILTKTGFEIRDVPIPEYGAHQVLVKLIGTGVCSGEIGAFKKRGEANERWLGHEGGGIITAVGSEVADLEVGDNVAILGGKFAEYTAIDKGLAVKLASTVEPAWSLGEPVACCVHAMRRCRISGGEEVALVGCGFMGLICMELARIHGAGRLTAIDPLEWRRRTATLLGADEALAPDSEQIEELKRKHGAMNGAYDVVVEATGIQPGIDLAGYLVKQHGLINLVGHHYSDGGMRTVYMNQWNVKAIDVVNGHVRRLDEKMEAMRRGMEWAASGELQIEPLVSFYPLFRIQNAFEDIVARKPGLIKAVIAPD